MADKDANQLRELKTIATIRSIGSSTRIEGSQMSNEQVEELLKNIKITKLESRDAQEVAGYFEALDIIYESFNEIQIRENDIKSLHNILLKHSTKDSWHKGDYKQMTNAVEATMSDGSKKIIFQTTEAGYATQDAMRALINWYNNENQVHPLIKCAAFVYEFVSIHPFQDGNGRMSRLLANLLLLKNGYHWIQYVSFEHEVESRKVEYYKVLRMCQAQRPTEDISLWVAFFLDCLKNIQTLLQDKIKRKSNN
ncbi:MAG: Fic family protein [Bacteroidales bacterium]|nr:Fic family protein [Bacteroidales bacterium]